MVMRGHAIGNMTSLQDRGGEHLKKEVSYRVAPTSNYYKLFKDIKITALAY